MFLNGGAVTGGHLYRVTWMGAGFQANRLESNNLTEGIVDFVKVGTSIYFTTTGLWNAGQQASCKVWRMPLAGGTASMVADLTSLGAPGSWGALEALGSTLHVFTFVSASFALPGEHWAIDTTTQPATAMRIGASLPAAARVGAIGQNFGALSANWDAAAGAFALTGVFGEVLWRDPVGNNVLRRVMPPTAFASFSDQLATGAAFDSNTATLVMGDKDGHVEQLRSSNAAFQLDGLSIPQPPGSYQFFVMGLASVPAAAGYLPDGPHGCPMATGAWPINYVDSLPTAGNSGFAFTLDSSAPIALLLFGVGNVAWSGGLLPFDLGPLGAPDCWLGTSADTLVATIAPLSIAIPLPLGAQTYYTQWAVLDAGANALGVVLSDARRMEIR